ncbi:MAG: hypothetical protein KKA65_00450 [Nanoarchaeota archaeon]|nr:hypothetical protein [Nanoarchaeota archaeon]MBU4242182.1 hypothetical protein [Nanoarchaeota archaeon]MBU4352171.1 hypothetical protein [Nanoarchaeota archaeon]MBU4455949.1 hypothetical protein [Nanoarchaeota archaeon]MCG2719115.1 hypothetical protein [Nanoarchaeota archaeon]
MAKDYECFRLSGDMSYGGKSLLFYTCNICEDQMSENDVLEHKCKKIPKDVVQNPNEYKGFTVVKRGGICRKTPEGLIFYNCKNCGSTIVEESILNKSHKCWAKKSIEDKL